MAVFPDTGWGSLSNGPPHRHPHWPPPQRKASLALRSFFFGFLFYSTHHFLTSYEVLTLSLFPVGLSALQVSTPERGSLSLLQLWRYSVSICYVNGSCMTPYLSQDWCVSKATPDAKTIPLEPTWGIEAVRVILGGVGCEDVHPCVVGRTDGVGVDTGDHHMPFYEPVPAKWKREVIPLWGCDGDCVTCHQMTSHTAPGVIRFTSGDHTGLNNWLHEIQKQQLRERRKGINTEGGKVILFRAL